MPPIACRVCIQNERLPNDAESNLFGAICIAAHFEIPEVCVFFNGSLLRGRRQGIHAQIAWALKEHVTDEEYLPATVAHHFTEAGLAAPAAAAWLAAAEFALSQSAPVEAERHSSVGLSLVPGICEGRERDAMHLYEHAI